ncbi:MAG: hypothetical protein Q9201_005999 [Fulgogasparrea decipioides]
MPASSSAHLPYGLHDHIGGNESQFQSPIGAPQPFIPGPLFHQIEADPQPPDFTSLEELCGEPLASLRQNRRTVVKNHTAEFLCGNPAQPKVERRVRRRNPELSKHPRHVKPCPLESPSDIQEDSQKFRGLPPAMPGGQVLSSEEFMGGNTLWWHEQGADPLVTTASGLPETRFAGNVLQ